MENAYKLFGVKYGASRDTIKEAYYKKMKKYHPDLCKGNKAFANEMTDRLNIAYDIMTNEELRKQHDAIYAPNETYVVDDTTYYGVDNSNQYNYENDTRTYSESENENNEEYCRRQQEYMDYINLQKENRSELASERNERKASKRMERQKLREQELRERILQRQTKENQEKKMSTDERKVEHNKWLWDLSVYISIGCLVFFLMLFCML